MPNFNSISELQAYIKKQAKIALKTQVGTRVQEIIQNYLKEQIYSQPMQSYQRFGNLLNGIKISEVYESGNSIWIEIYFSNDTFEEYSWYGDSMYEAGQRISMNSLIYYLEEGYTINRDKTTILESTINELNSLKQHVIAFKSYLQSNGINVK